MTPTKIMIAEDMPLEVYGLRDILSGIAGFELLAAVNNGRLLLQTLNNLQPNVLLLDINLPQMDGMEAAKRIRATNKTLKIVFVSSRYDSEVKKCIDTHNINGFIFKGTINDNAFIDLLQRISKGEKVIDAPLSQKEALQYKVANGMPTKYSLTQTEMIILQFVAQGFATKVIAAKLVKSTRTIDAHRRTIIEKLEVGNMTEAVALAIREGIIKAESQYSVS